MNSLIRLAYSWAVAFGFAAFAFSQDVPIEVNEVPFEPISVPFFRPVEKFVHPQEVASPNFLYPFELRRTAVPGEAIILVVVDANGMPKRLSALSGTHSAFIKAAIEALKKAKWDLKEANHERPLVCFYYKATFKIE